MIKANPSNNRVSFSVSSSISSGRALVRETGRGSLFVGAIHPPYVHLSQSLRVSLQQALCQSVSELTPQYYME